MNRRISFFQTGLVLVTLLTTSWTFAFGQSTFDDARTAYFREDLRDATRDLILQEKVLTVRLRVLLSECNRHGIRFPADIDALLNPKSPWFTESVSPVTMADSADVSSRIQTWISSQQEDLQLRLDHATALRSRFIELAPPEALFQIFQDELREAIEAYAASDAVLAGNLLHDIRIAYPYVNMDDIVFHEAEAWLADGAWDTAASLYLELLRTWPESTYRAMAFQHLIYIRSHFNQHALAVKEAREFGFDQNAYGDLAYLTGREFFLHGLHKEARFLLNHLKPQDEHFFEARHLMGLSLIIQEEFSQAIDVFESLQAKAWKGGFGKDPHAGIREDARLKLGYLYFEEGRFEAASSMFTSLPVGGERHPEVLLGLAWSSLSLNNPKHALKLVVQVVEHYPGSPFRYEAMTLAGFASESMNNPEGAARWYDLVLVEADKAEALRELGSERLQILHLLRKLVRMESQIFTEGQDETFEGYLDLRRQARILMRKVRYSELQAANEEMAAFIEERGAIISLNRSLMDLIHEGVDTPQKRQEVASLKKEVRGLLRRIRLSGLLEIGRQPLMAHERTMQTTQQMLDSLNYTSRHELAAIDRQEEMLEAYQGDMRTSLTRHRFNRMSLDVEHLRSQAALMRQPAPLSDLNRWSELSFTRTAVGDMPFEELQDVQKRMQDLDYYLETIDELLNQAASQNEMTPGGTSE